MRITLPYGLLGLLIAALGSTTAGADIRAIAGGTGLDVLDRGSIPPQVRNSVPSDAVAVTNGDSRPVSAMAFTPDGRTLIVSTRGRPEKRRSARHNSSLGPPPLPLKERRNSMAIAIGSTRWPFRPLAGYSFPETLGSISLFVSGTSLGESRSPPRSSLLFPIGGTSRWLSRLTASGWRRSAAATTGRSSSGTSPPGRTTSSRDPC